jgi:hypothetical protein
MQADSWGHYLDQMVGEAIGSALAYGVGVVISGTPPTTLAHHTGFALPSAGVRIDAVVYSAASAGGKSVTVVPVQGARFVGLAAGSIAAGDLVGVDGSGKFLAIGSMSTGDALVGKAMAGGSGNGALVPILGGNYGTK